MEKSHKNGIPWNRVSLFAFLDVFFRIFAQHGVKSFCKGWEIQYIGSLLAWNYAEHHRKPENQTGYLKISISIDLE